MKFKLVCSAVLLPILAACETTPPRADVAQIQAFAETERVASTGDAADDPALWIAPDPAESRIVGTDKQAGLYVYDLAGNSVQFVAAGRVNNVDIRQGVALGPQVRDLAVASDRDNIALAVFTIDAESGELAPAANGLIPIEGFVDPYGACLYHAADGRLYAFVTDRDPGTVVQIALGWDEAGVTGEEVRRFTVGSITEGCVADDRTGQLYLAEEMVSVWRYSAEPGGGDARVAVIPVDGVHLTEDAEGLALVERGDTGGWLFISSQGDSSYTVVDLQTFDVAGRFGIGGGAIDEVSGTDGIEVSAAALPGHPRGIMMTQDDEDDEGGQNFKFVDLGAILDALGLE
ncbi:MULTISPECIES: phytase [Hyphobacterium]|uniref:Phytase n=1 Tax=Hyphobacterium vulgare TaxID=1736751 RepID=A0ABV6ZZ89_9PROT